jgi:hypothetical protein
MLQHVADGDDVATLKTCVLMYIAQPLQLMRTVRCCTYRPTMQNAYNSEVDILLTRLLIISAISHCIIISSCIWWNDVSKLTPLWSSPFLLFFLGGLLIHQLESLTRKSAVWFHRKCMTPAADLLQWVTCWTAVIGWHIKCRYSNVQNWMRSFLYNINRFYGKKTEQAVSQWMA